METPQIEAVLSKCRHTKPYFLGVFPADGLPSKINSFPALLVANTDPGTEKGSHWVCFYFTARYHAEYFDSYGRAPLLSSFKEFIKKNSIKWHFSKRRLQDILSGVCGEYCILYLVHRAKKRSRKSFLKRYTHNPLKNDMLTAQRYSRFAKNLERK